MVENIWVNWIIMFSYIINIKLPCGALRNLQSEYFRSMLLQVLSTEMGRDWSPPPGRKSQGVLQISADRPVTLRMCITWPGHFLNLQITTSSKMVQVMINHRLLMT